MSHFILLVRPFLKITVLLTTSLLLAQSTALWTEQLAFWSRAELEKLRQRMQAIEAERLQLPESRLTQTSSRRGFQSSRVGDDEPLWVEVTLPEESLVDAVALIPLVVLKDDGSSTCFGFPLLHRIEAIDAEGRIQIVHESAADLPNPDGFPVLQRITPLRASRIRVTVTKPWQRSELRVLALSEIMVFSGKRNLALGATVTASSSRQEPPAWSVENLTDHVTPLGLPVLPGAPAIKGFHSALAKSAQDSKHVGIVLPRRLVLYDAWPICCRHLTILLLLSCTFLLLLWRFLGRRRAQTTTPSLAARRSRFNRVKRTTTSIAKKSNWAMVYVVEWIFMNGRIGE